MAVAQGMRAAEGSDLNRCFYVKKARVNRGMHGDGEIYKAEPRRSALSLGFSVQTLASPFYS